MRPLNPTQGDTTMPNNPLDWQDINLPGSTTHAAINAVIKATIAPEQWLALIVHKSLILGVRAACLQ
jgi:hypothetical protein